MTLKEWLEKVSESIGAFEKACGYSYAQGADHGLSKLISDSIGNYCLISDLANYMGVKPSSQMPGMISYYENPEKRIKGIRNRTKPGRFFRKFYPLATDSECENFANKFKDAYRVREYDVFESKDESAFVEAYTGKITENTSHGYGPVKGYEVKSLSGSCMRKSFGSFIHPARAYASGDFTMIYAKEKVTGLIGARVVVGNESAAPIYTNCNHATKALADYLHEKGIEPDSDWDGLKLAKIEARDGPSDYLCPYLDGYSGVEDCGDYLSIGGDIEFSTHGYVSIIPQEWCECCENCVDSGDMREVFGGDSVCRSCRSQHYTYSSLMGEYIRDDDSIPVNGDIATQDWIDSQDYVFCAYLEEYRDASHCIEYNGDWYAKDSCVVYEVNGKHYHEDSSEYQDALEKREESERLEREAFETVTVSSGFEWLSNADSYRALPTPYLAYTEQKETRLRDNYQLDSNGIPQRLPEFDFDLIDLTPELI